MDQSASPLVQVEVEDSRGKKRKTTKKAMEYLYEPELEQVWLKT
jgi:hypothetical protein